MSQSDFSEALSNLLKVTHAFLFFEQSVKGASTAVTIWDRSITELDLLGGGNEARRKHLKHPGVQFARYLPGYGLVQFKRLANGVVVKV